MAGYLTGMAGAQAVKARDVEGRWHMHSRGAHLHGRGTCLGVLVSMGGEADFLHVKGAALAKEMTLHERVGARELLGGVRARSTGCKHHEWLD